ncbi:MAG: hypothetical protein CFE31_04755 [Rhizobiales bacterium PAR1]|nr:MAG: hypothetical protein CFE31_04755 [Rhizobiales bacterium PAR1]
MSDPLSIVCILPDEAKNDFLAERLALTDSDVTIAANFQPNIRNKTDILIFRPADLVQAVAETVRNWQNVCSGMCLFAVLGEQEAESIPSLFQSGVVAFIHPAASVDELKASFTVVKAGGVYFSKAIAAALFSSSGQTAAGLGLTPREQEIMQLLAVNMSNKDIARKLDLSVRTVETHRMNIRKKTGARNRRSLANIAEKLGLMGEEYGFRKPLARRPAASGFHED